MHMPSADPALSGILLLCIDLQPNFLKAIPGADLVQRRCAFAIQAATGLGIDVVFTEQVPQKLGGTTPELLGLVKKSVTFGKITFSALADDGIRDALCNGTVEHVLLCGIETSVCVYQTALDAIAANLQVTLLSDCVASRRSDDARVCLDALIRAGVHVLPSESVFYSLLHGVQHPFFRGFTQLVKTYT